MPSRSPSAASPSDRIHRWQTFGCLVGLLLAIGLVRAEERSVHVRWLGAEDGLLQSSILGLHQDAEGFVWIATQGGLHRHDGHRMLRFRQQPDQPEGLPENFVTALADADGGGLFVGTRSSGLFRIDRQQRVRPVPLGHDEPAHHAIRALASDGPRLWIASAAGIHRLDADGRIAQWRWPEPGITARRLLPLHDVAWIATDRGLFRTEGDALQPVTAIHGAVHDLVDAEGGQLWLARDAGLFLHDMASSRSRRVWPKPGEPDAAVLRIGRGAGDQLWLARGRDGLLQLTPRSGDALPLRPDGRMPGALQNDVFVNLLVDRSGLVWAGTEFSGVARFDGDLSPFRLIIDPDRGAEQPVPDRVRALYEEAPGVLLIGSEADGLKRYHRASQRFESLSAPINAALGLAGAAPLRIYAILSDGAGGLLLATHGGIVRWPAAAAPVRLPGTPVGDAVRTLLRARDGRLWAGTTASGIFVLNLDGSGLSQLSPGPEGLTDSLITALHEDARGRVWVGTTAGLNRVDPDGSIHRYQRQPGEAGTLPSHGVRTLAESSSGELWLGTFAGLARVVEDPEGLRFERVSGLDDTLDDTIYGILEDSGGRLWLSTNLGIVRLDPKRRETRRYGIEDGLQGLEFNGGAQLTSADGEFLFGGVHGINAFRPERIRDARYAPPVVLTGVTAGRDSLLPASGGMTLEQADRYFRFDFAVLDYYAPERNRFRYRLDGWDSDWTEDLGIGHAIYMNLPAGNYRLHVQGSNRDGRYSERELVLPLTLRAPWYATALVQGAATLLLIGGALTLIWFAIDRRRQRRAHLHDLHEREERLRVALWGSNESYWDWDMLTDTLRREGAERVLGRQVAAVASHEDYRTRDIHPEDYERVMGRARAHARGETEHFEAQYRMRGGSGHWVWVCARGRVVERNADGKPTRMAGTLRNIDAERAAERERALAAEVLASMAEAVAVLDLQLRFVSVNPAFERLSGRSSSELEGAELSALSGTRHAEVEFEAIGTVLRNDGQWRGELWQRRADGAEYLLEIELRRLGESGSGGREAALIVAVGSDVTEKRRAEQELRYLANFDVLTGLPNRTMLLARLGTAISRARALKEQVAILFIDLDRFKPINDSLGHAAGDELLRSLGRRLTEVLGPEMLVARLAGDEFTVVIEHVRDTATVYRAANRLLSALGDPIAVLGNELSVTPSIGIALYPSHGDNAADLLKSADAAMYSAKSAGRNTFRVYNAELAAQAQQRLQMEAALRRALDRGEFRLLYQPILALKPNRIVGLEALLRWQHPRFGFVGPDRFVPILEETGLITTVGRWVIDAAIEDLARWQAEGRTGIKMAVNVSTLQLLRHELKDEIAESLQRHGIDGNLLELEVTESLLMSNPDATAQTLAELKTLGVGVAIDDFGTGYSSLSYLKRLPIDKLKIDQSFVRDLGQGGEDRTIVNMVIAMAHTLGIRATAEGVETLEQMRFLEQQGCDEVQGFLIAKPQTAAEIGKLLQRPGRSLVG